MADNFLERRMEDLRSGRLSLRNQAASSVRKSASLSFPFPARRVLVTGGCHGIGRAVARAFLAVGCKVAVMDIDASAGEEMARKEGIRFLNVDLRNREDIESAMKNIIGAWRDIDIIVSNAGIFKVEDIADAEDSFDDIISVNLRPAYILARVWARHRESLPLPNPYGGRFFMISSTRHIQSEPATEAYAASKGGLASLAHALMMSLSKYSITVNSISPGWIQTDENEQLRDSDHSQHPSGRVGTPEDIARLITFLSIEQNNFINGIDIPIDGGMTHKMIYTD